MTQEQVSLIVSAFVGSCTYGATEVMYRISPHPQDRDHSARPQDRDHSAPGHSAVAVARSVAPDLRMWIQFFESLLMVLVEGASV